MKIFEQDHIYHHDWETVTSAFFNKYPNHVQTHVKNIDVIDRNINIDDKTMKLKRIMQTQFNIPYAIKNFFNIDDRGIIIEDINVNLKKKKLTLTSINHTLSPYIKSVETCIYYQNGDNEHQTCYKQSMSLNISGFGFMRKFIEKTLLNNITEKSKVGINIMNDTIKRVLNENMQMSNNNIFNDVMEKTEK
ncbi:MSF1-like protein, putative [Hepatocystis sp. ex Piliocolobus tephrosceles]|nr:MSF1-like protein, putative [Hepatocystis sp. ex Piliocolobus tephrosceles]